LTCTSINFNFAFFDGPRRLAGVTVVVLSILDCGVGLNQSTPPSRPRRPSQQAVHPPAASPHDEAPSASHGRRGGGSGQGSTAKRLIAEALVRRITARSFPASAPSRSDPSNPTTPAREPGRCGVGSSRYVAEFEPQQTSKREVQRGALGVTVHEISDAMK